MRYNAMILGPHRLLDQETFSKADLVIVQLSSGKTNWTITEKKRAN